MNPLTNMKNVTKLSERELYTGNKTSWHDQYRDSAWVFIGGLPFDLTEGDIICIFSQYGEIVNINLIRDKDTGKSKGFCFLCYEDQRSTDLSVDNLNGIKILNRAVRVDHVSNYKVPKQGKKTDVETKRLYDEGCAPQHIPVQPIVPKVNIKRDPDDVRETLADQINSEIKLPRRLPIAPIKVEKVEEEEVTVKKEPKEKKPKKSKKKKSKKKRSNTSDSSDGESSKSGGDKKKKKKHKRKKKNDSSDSEESSDSDDGEKNKVKVETCADSKEWSNKYGRSADKDKTYQRRSRSRSRDRGTRRPDHRRSRSRSHERDGGKSGERRDQPSSYKKSRM